MGVFSLARWIHIGILILSVSAATAADWNTSFSCASISPLGGAIGSFQAGSSACVTTCDAMFAATASPNATLLVLEDTPLSPANCVTGVSPDSATVCTPQLRFLTPAVVHASQLTEALGGGASTVSAASANRFLLPGTWTVARATVLCRQTVFDRASRVLRSEQAPCSTELLC